LLEGGVDHGSVERPLAAHHLHGCNRVIVILFHQIFARLHGILLSHNGSQTGTDEEEGNNDTNAHRVRFLPHRELSQQQP
jgi:hypothetical protein